MSDVKITVEIDGRPVFVHTAVGAPVAHDALAEGLQAALAHNTASAPGALPAQKKTEGSTL